MKKSLFNLILGVFTTAILFTSCLGDSNNEFGNDNIFAYITTHEKTGEKVAALYNNVYISSSVIDALETGKCYLISYKVSTENLSANGVFENASVYGVSESITSTTGTVATPTMEETFNPTDFAPYFVRPDSFMGDNWGFYYTITTLREKDTPKAYFFYDADKQYEMADGVRKDVGTNQIIIDVRFNYTAGVDGGSVLTQQKMSVGNLSMIKSAFKYSDNFEKGSENYVDIAIKFRYNQLQSDKTTVKEDVYVGSWTSPPYFFRYFNN